MHPQCFTRLNRHLVLHPKPHSLFSRGAHSYTLSFRFTIHAHANLTHTQIHHTHTTTSRSHALAPHQHPRHHCDSLKLVTECGVEVSAIAPPSELTAATGGGASQDTGEDGEEGGDGGETKVVEAWCKKKLPVKASVLNVVDLAGSERAGHIKKLNSEQRQQMKEGSAINKSLLVLGSVISKLSEGAKGHINFRDSKLTRLLSTALGGNCKRVNACVCE